MKTALITGANKSIGFETARQLLQLDFYVYLGCRKLEDGQQAVQQLMAEGFSTVEAIQLDVNDPESIQAARNDIGMQQESLDVLVNNAGINGGVALDEHGKVKGFKTATETPIAIFKEVFETNLFGVIRVTQGFIDLLKIAPQPRIVNVSSSSGSLTLHSDPTWWAYEHKDAAYLPSKAALNMYTINLAYELRNTTFKVNAVDPGFTATDFNNHNGTGTVAEAGRRIVKYATIGTDGPSGCFISEEYNPETGEIPW